VLARPQDVHRQRPVIDGAGSEDDRIQILSREQLGIAAGWDSEPSSHLFGAPLPGRRDRYQLGSPKPLGVLGMKGAHPAETGDAKPKMTRRP